MSESSDAVLPDRPAMLQFRLIGIDCADDVAKIEKATRALPGIGDVYVSLTAQMLTVQAQSTTPADMIEATVSNLGFQAIQMPGGSPSESDFSTEAYLTPGYKRALWLVVILNVGYGIVEFIAGLLGDSQALRADALDFFGDGVISLLGLVAIGWHPSWRARSALIQGIFLGALGTGVFASTIYRIFVPGDPRAETMGVFGFIALVVNLTAAFLLMSHRSGDASMRAVWLFSRNDALGNLAVVIAAAIVAWTGTGWPDTIVAFVIAGLFLQSAWSIINDARRELASARRAEIARRSP